MKKKICYFIFVLLINAMDEGLGNSFSLEPRDPEAFLSDPVVDLENLDKEENGIPDSLEVDPDQIEEKEAGSDIEQNLREHEERERNSSSSSESGSRSRSHSGSHSKSHSKSKSHSTSSSGSSSGTSESDDFELEDEHEEDDPLGILNSKEESETQSEEEDAHTILHEHIPTHHNLNGFMTPTPYPSEEEDTDMKRHDKIGDEHLDNLLDEFRFIKCFKEHEDDKVPDFCASNKEATLLSRLGTVDYTPLMLYNWLDQHLYKPLGYKMYAQFTFPDVFSNFLDISKQDTMIHPEMQIPNNPTFMKSVLENFKNIEDFSGDFDLNKNKISDVILQLLKKFHIFWNVHRQRNELKNLHSNTLDILRNILLKYKQTNDAMKATTINILANIKNAYYRFIRANKLKSIILDRPGEMLTVEILRRYKNNIEKIHSGESSFQIQVQEISYILDLLRAFFIINYKSDFTDTKNQKLYDIFIEEKMHEMYADYQRYLLELGDDTYNDFKDFTATLILKMRLKKFLIFDKYSIAAYINMPVSSFDSEFEEAISVYYEFLDSMMILPSNCGHLSFEKAQECLHRNSSEIMVELDKKYQLGASVPGTLLIEYLNSNIESLLNSVSKPEFFTDITLFKHEYFNNLFEFTENFREKYHIRKMKIIEDLENEIGFQVEKSKTLHSVSKISYAKLDELDRELYDLFLKIKSKFNKYAPINKDFKVMMIIAKTIDSLIEKFVIDTDQVENEEIITLVTRIKNIINAWLTDHSVHYLINSHPLNLDSTYEDANDIMNGKEAANHEKLNKNVINYNLANPLGFKDSDPLIP